VASDDTKKRARSVLRTLMNKYPDAGTALRHDSAFELLIATILSAQCTDKKVNEVTEVLFDQYPGPEELAEADEEDLHEILKPTGFYRQKTESVQEASRELLERFDGEVPANMDDLTSLPGVARKTANVVLSQWFEKPVGVVVDTHVKRLSHRLGFSEEKQPEKIEQDLMDLFPKSKWIPLASVLIMHGRETCTAKKPECEECAVADRCPRIGVD
jgi:endonuclease-3